MGFTIVEGGFPAAFPGAAFHKHRLSNFELIGCQVVQKFYGPHTARSYRIKLEFKNIRDDVLEIILYETTQFHSLTPCPNNNNNNICDHLMPLLASTIVDQRGCHLAWDYHDLKPPRLSS